MDPCDNPAYRPPLQLHGSFLTRTNGHRGYGGQPSLPTQPTISSPPATHYFPTATNSTPTSPWPQVETHTVSHSTTRPLLQHPTETSSQAPGAYRTQEVWRTEAYAVAHSWATPVRWQNMEGITDTNPIVVSAVYARPMLRDLFPNPIYVDIRGRRDFATPPDRETPASTPHPRRN